MQNNTPYYRYALFLLLTLLFSCNKFDDLKSPVDNFNIILNYDIFDTFITIRLIDTQTGELIGATDDEKTEVTISGKSAAAVVDQTGNHYSAYQSVYGMVSLALNPKNPWIPGQENILELSFSTKSDRFSPASAEVLIDSTGNYMYDIYLERADVVKRGVKEYTRNLSLTDDSRLEGNFLFSSTGDEAGIQIPAGIKFLDTSGNPVSGEQVRFNMKVYLNTSNAPVPNGLIQSIKDASGNSKSMAVDFYRILEVSFFSEDGSRISAVSDGQISVTGRFANNSYHPAKKRVIRMDDPVLVLLWNSAGKQWEETGQKQILKDDTGFYSIADLNRLSFIAWGNATPACALNSQFQFAFTNKFDELPLGVRLNLYRKRDNRYIGNKTLNISNDNQVVTADFTSITDEPVVFGISYVSAYNPFTATPSAVSSEISCGNLQEPFTIDLTSTRTQVDGLLKINFSDPGPQEAYPVYIDIYHALNHSRLYRVQYSIKRTDTELRFATGILANQPVYLKLISADPAISISTTPEKVNFNTTNGPFEWQMNIAPKDISSLFRFDFVIHPSFGKRQLWVKADFYNAATSKVDFSQTFSINSDNPSSSFKLVLPEKMTYRIRLKRLEGKEQYMAYPWKYYITTGSNRSFTFDSEVTPVEKKHVNARVRLQCGSSLIYPTLNGMYRTVWDDRWTNVDIKDGYFSGMMEIGGTYEIGTIIEGKLSYLEYLLTTTEIDMSMEVEGGFCDKMGW